MTCVSSSFVISSPSTSIVASLRCALCTRTVAVASLRRSPAMYRCEIRRTTGRGTAGRSRTIALSRSTGRLSPKVYGLQPRPRPGERFLSIDACARRGFAAPPLTPAEAGPHRGPPKIARARSAPARSRAKSLHFARSRKVRQHFARLLAHEALARRAHERDRLRKEHAHRVAQGDRLLVGAALHGHPLQ